MFNIIELVFITIIASIICYYLHHLCRHLYTLSKNLSQNNKEASTVLIPVVKMDLKSECTTVLPVPIGAEMCHHKMEVITNRVLHTPHEEKCIVILQCTSCGTIDKTIAVTSPAPVLPTPPQPKSECRHCWVKEKSITISSAFEQMEDFLKERNRTGASKPLVGKKKESAEDEKNSNFDLATAPAWMFQKKICLQRVCSKCGTIDRVVASNFETEESVEAENYFGEQQNS